MSSSYERMPSFVSVPSFKPLNKARIIYATREQTMLCNLVVDELLRKHNADSLVQEQRNFAKLPPIEESQAL